MVSGIFSLPELLVTMQYAPQDLRNGAVDYLKTNGVKDIPNDLKLFAQTKQEEMKALWNYAETELKDKFLDDNGNIDIGRCYESAGYLTVFIASFFIGAGEAKSASAAGEAGGKASGVVSKAAKLTETPLDEMANLSKTPIDDALRLAETPVDEVGRAAANGSDDALRASEKAAEVAGNTIDNGNSSAKILDNIKNYVRDVEDKTGRKLAKNQIEELKNALRNKEYTKQSPKEVAKHRNEFNRIKNDLIQEWEINTNSKWPIYETDVISEKTGNVVRKAGDLYDAHHLIENCFLGDNAWWNIHPARFPNEHQLGIHLQGAPASILFE